MSAIQDSKGRIVPAWSRYPVAIAAAGSLSGYKEDGGTYIPFALYLNEESDVVFTPVEADTTEITFTFGPGYHAIAFATIVSTSTAAMALYAHKPF